MTATERVRELLDECGVDYRVSATGYSIDIGPYTTAYANRSDTTLDVSLRQVTPEQAIAATLGDVPSLPHFWTHDGTLHVELPKLPESISVRLPDQCDREVGSARTWQYTRDSGTCEVEESWHGESEMVEYRCTACDEYMAVEVVKPDGAQPPNYCPNCGAKVVEPTTNDVDAEVNGG